MSVVFAYSPPRGRGAGPSRVRPRPLASGQCGRLSGGSLGAGASPGLGVCRGVRRGSLTIRRNGHARRGVHASTRRKAVVTWQDFRIHERGPFEMDAPAPTGVGVGRSSGVRGASLRCDAVAASSETAAAAAGPVGSGWARGVGPEPLSFGGRGRVGVVKLLRARGGCLGVIRWRAWKAAKSPGELPNER